MKISLKIGKENIQVSTSLEKLNNFVHNFFFSFSFLNNFYTFFPTHKLLMTLKQC